VPTTPGLCPLLMTDDTGWNDFGAYTGDGAALGHPTPNVDQIAKEGATFTSWYGQASCRASFMTGRIPIRSPSRLATPSPGKYAGQDNGWVMAPITKVVMDFNNR
jgi:arylsulfatase A-like enzyme